MAFTKITGPGIHTLTNIVSHNVKSSGIITAVNGNLNGWLAVGSTASFSGNVSIGGTLTYDDVTNVDSVGIITARDGIRVTGGSVGIGTNNPQKTLNVFAGVGTTELVRLSQPVDSSVQQNFGIGWCSNNNHTWPGAQITSLEYDVSDPRRDLLFYTRGVNSDSAPTERLRITSAGNVGIGTTNPTTGTTLDVYRNDPSDAGTIQITQDGTGDATIDFQLVGTREYSLGIDNSDGDKFKLSGNAGLGNNTLLTVTSDGEVGIGTTNPKTRLNVYTHPNTNTGGILVQNANYSSNLDKAYLIAGTQNWTGAATDWNTYGFQHKIKSDSGGTPRLTIDGSAGGSNLNEIITFMVSGKVGIGTIDPDAPIHVQSSDNTLGILTSTDDGANLDLSDNDTMSRIRSVDGRLHLYADFGSNVSNSSIRFFVDGNNEKVRITDSGRVGIGTTNPTTGLQIGGLSVDSDNVIKLGRRINSNNTNLPLIGHHSGDGTGSGLALCATSSAGAIHFFTGNGGNGFGVSNNKERVIIKHDGKVGIGTTNPNSILHIYGGDDVDCVLSLESDADNSGGENHTPYIRFGTDGGIYNSSVGVNQHNVANQEDALVLSNSANSNGGIIFRTNSSNGWANAAERLRITPDGQVLIGNSLNTTHSESTGTLIVDGGDSNIGGIQVHAGDGENVGDLAGISFSHGNSGTASRPKAAIALEKQNLTSGRGDLCFYVDGTNDNNKVSTTDERLRITSGGLVGIGSTDPGNMLNISNPDGTDCLKLNISTAAGGSNKQNAIRFSVDNVVKAHMGVAVDAGRVVTTSNANDFCLKTNQATDILLAPNGNESLRIDSSRRILIGRTSNNNGTGTNPIVQIQSTSTNNYGRIELAYAGGNTLGPAVYFVKARGSDADSVTAAGSADQCGALFFLAADGNDRGNRVASIQAYTNGTISSNVTPGKLVFRTTPSNDNATLERLSIDSAGIVQLNTANNTYIRGGIYAKYTGASGDTANINTSSAGKISWLVTNTEIFENGGFTNTATDVTVPKTGIYQVILNGYLESANIRTNVRFRYRINGTDSNEDLSLNNYIRRDSGHNESSVNFVAYLNLSAGDTVAVSAQAVGAAGDVTMLKDHSSLTFHLVA